MQLPASKRPMWMAVRETLDLFKDHVANSAREILEAVQEGFGLSDADPKKPVRGHYGRGRIAVRFHRQTTMSQSWITE